jgi:hypothetical protein
MVNGLHDLHGVKGFFSEIVAGIRSIMGIFAAFSIAMMVRSEMKDVTKMAM